MISLHHCREIEAVSLTKFKLLKAFKVIHCFDAFAVAIVIYQGKKDPILLIYSGDTRPSAQFATGVKSSYQNINFERTILIHEATYDEKHANLAEKKRHSTINEAKSIANLIQADVLILTHFSTRYAASDLEINQENSNRETVLASDFMQIDLRLN